MCLFGVLVTLRPIWGFVPKNLDFRGVNRRFQAKCAKYSNFPYYRNYCTDHSQILHNDKDHQLPSWVVQICFKQIQDGGWLPSSGKVMVGNINFYNFWCFLFVAVNTMDKSLFFSIYNSSSSALTLLVGRQEGHLACKNGVVGCWHGYLSGARCRFAYSPADKTATHYLLLQ